MDNEKILNRIQALKASAMLLFEEATSLERELAGVSTPAVRKGRYAASTAKVLAKRNKTILRKTAK